jgi:hypothetical protein
MKSFIHEAEQAKGVGPEFVVKARTIADKFDVPVEWLLAAMSWETTQYTAYNPEKLTNGFHWARNTSDGGGGLVGFTPFPSNIAAKTPVEQLDDVEIYFRNTIKHFKIPSPFASPEDFYCVVYALGISGKPDSYTWTYLGKTYTKKTQLDIYRGFLGRYDMPATGDDLQGTEGSFLWWAPGQTKKVGWAATTDANVPVRSGPGRSYDVVTWLPLSGTRVQVLDQTLAADIIDGNAKWDRISSGYVTDTQIAFK